MASPRVAEILATVVARSSGGASLAACLVDLCGHELPVTGVGLALMTEDGPAAPQELLPDAGIDGIGVGAKDGGPVPEHDASQSRLVEQLQRRVLRDQPRRLLGQLQGAIDHGR